MQIKVSVIIPIYNVEKYIKQCLDSVCKQTLNEIEIICINDGTLDSSMDIVESVKNRDNRIVIINKENGGLSSARNTGLKVAKGEYIYFLDSDDYILDDTLEVLYTIASENQLDDIFFDAIPFFETEVDEKINENYMTYYKRNSLYEEVMSGQELFTKMVQNKDMKPSACLQMLRRQFLLDYKIEFYEGIIHEDNLFTLQIVIVAKRTMHIAKSFYMRRVRQDSIVTREKGVRNSVGYFVCATESIQFIEKYQVSDEFKSAVVNFLTVIHKSAINAIKQVSHEEIIQELERYPVHIQINYRCLIEKNAEIKRIQEQSMQDKELKIAEMKSIITDSDITRKKQEQLIKNHESKIRKIKSLLADNDKVIQKQEWSISKQEKRIQKQEKLISKYEDLINKQEKLIQKQELEITDIINSESYKLGHFIVMIPGKIKKIVNKIFLSK